MVEWRSHPLHEQYEISSDGRIRSTDRTITSLRNGVLVNVSLRGRELAVASDSFGYVFLTLAISGRRFNVRMHRLVCEAFHGLQPAPDLEVRHLNGVKTDNRPENLAWGTHSENQHDAVRHGTHSKVAKTHCPQGHPYTPENTYKRPARSPERLCRTCRREKNRARKAARARAAA